ncbi:hypothetical protein Bca101_033638 [Brassica carinata]
MDLLRKELYGGLMNCTRSPVIRRRGANQVSRGIFNMSKAELEEALKHHPEKWIHEASGVVYYYYSLTHSLTHSLTVLLAKLDENRKKKKKRYLCSVINSPSKWRGDRIERDDEESRDAMDLLRKELHGGLMKCTRSPVIRRRRRRGANHVSRGIFNYLIFSGTGARSWFDFNQQLLARFGQEVTAFSNGQLPPQQNLYSKRLCRKQQMLKRRKKKLSQNRAIEKTTPFG